MKRLTFLASFLPVASTPVVPPPRQGAPLTPAANLAASRYAVDLDGVLSVGAFVRGAELRGVKSGVVKGKFGLHRERRPSHDVRDCGGKCLPTVLGSGCSTFLDGQPRNAIYNPRSPSVMYRCGSVSLLWHHKLY